MVLRHHYRLNAVRGWADGHPPTATNRYSAAGTSPVKQNTLLEPLPTRQLGGSEMEIVRDLLAELLGQLSQAFDDSGSESPFFLCAIDQLGEAVLNLTHGIKLTGGYEIIPQLNQAQLATTLTMAYSKILAPANPGRNPMNGQRTNLTSPEAEWRH